LSAQNTTRNWLGDCSLIIIVKNYEVLLSLFSSRVFPGPSNVAKVQALLAVLPNIQNEANARKTHFQLFYFETKKNIIKKMHIVNKKEILQQITVFCKHKYHYGRT
jgi:hypothetical protein